MRSSTGPGLVARYDEVAVWAGPQASPALQVHLVNEAQRTSKGPNGGDQLASSLIAILQRGDPEPQAPFAVVGPGANGLTLFLHGPVQAWDSGRWLAPQPVPGWIVTSIGRPWPLIILPYGASPPPQSQQGNPLDLVAGAVPGAGFVMLRPPVAGGQGAAAPQAAATPQPSPAGYEPRRQCSRWGCRRGDGGRRGPARPGCGRRWRPAPVLEGQGRSRLAGAAALGAAAGMAAGATDLRRAPEGSKPVSRRRLSPPLLNPRPKWRPHFRRWPSPPPDSSAAPGGTAVDLRERLRRRPSAAGPGHRSCPFLRTGQPEVMGVRCELGHFNHPRVSNCLRCGRPVPRARPRSTVPALRLECSWLTTARSGRSAGGASSAPSPARPRRSSPARRRRSS